MLQGVSGRSTDKKNVTCCVISDVSWLRSLRSQ